VLRITKRILSAAPSPDGRWIVLYAQSPQEDLFLVRPDGSDLRQLTDDPHHDRTPRWSADGKWIFFYTDRNQHYEVWAIRPDGSGAHRVVSGTSDEVFNPVPSPDGRWLAVRGFSGAALVDLSRPPAQRVPVPFTARGTGGQVFVPRAWSPDMTWMAGTLHAPATLLRVGMGLYSPASGAFARLPEDGGWPVFLDDGETVLYLKADLGAIRAWNRGTGRSWTVATPPDGQVFRYLSLSSDHRRLFTVRGTSEGDIWLHTSLQRR
jgi:WD40 repeat protein